MPFRFLLATKKRKKTSTSAVAGASTSKKPPAADADASSRRSLKDAKVLIVEDDPASRRLLHLVLSLAGAEDIREAGDAETAIRLLSTFTPDLVLIDLVLPQVGGFELVAGLRRAERERRRAHARRSQRGRARGLGAPKGAKTVTTIADEQAPPPPVVVYIAVTSFSAPGIEQRAREAGFSAFIEKPFDVETIADDIAEVLRSARENRKGGMIQ